MDTRQPILIIGAGISGLTLAQACRKEKLPFSIFERDASPTFRSAGWGLTLNWALPTFRSLLPEDILSRLPETYVHKTAVDAGEKGSFTFFDLSTGEAKWKVPAVERIRVSRERLRKLLLSGLEVEWSKTLINVSKTEDGITATFADGTFASGSFLVACDGAHSAVRRQLHPDSFQNYELPVRFVGTSVVYPESQISAIRNLDPYFLQGSDPQTDVFLWFSFLDTPGDSGAPAGERMYRCQVMTSWPYRENFFDRAFPTDVPNTNRGRRIWMRTISEKWAEPFRSLVQDIPDDADFKPVELVDWLPRCNEAGVFDGRVVLLGDAAHTMVMFRGEGANHAIVDVEMLLRRLRPLFQAGDVAGVALRDAVKGYEDEVLERTELAVLASRRACLDAHEFARIDDKSPLVRRRVMRVDLDEDGM